MEQTAERQDWSIQTIMWYAVLVWFSSSLLSQSLYLALYREPYDAIVLLKALGPLYYVVVVVEIVMWISLLVIGVQKMKSLKKVNTVDPVTSYSL